jgi:hypothetical protein
MVFFFENCFDQLLENVFLVIRNNWIVETYTSNKLEMVFCYQNYSDLLWETIILVMEKNIWNSRLKAENLQNFIQTEKCQNNFL